MADASLAQRVYREFSPEPLPPERLKELYVDLDQARGSMETVPRLERTIRLAEGTPTCQVLAGHKGSGKSTEFFRLKKKLETGENPFFVVYVQADDDIDRNDVDFPDVLIAVVRQMATQLKERAGITLKPGYFADRLERVKGILTSEIDFQSFELDTGLLKLGGAMKGSPDARKQIREILEPDTSNLLHAANDVISQAAIELAKKKQSGLVVLVDDLDKMVVRPHEDTRSTTDEYLFVNRAAQLTAFHCHVVYTIPISLAYSHHNPTIAANYGGHVPLVPMTRITARPPKTTRYKRGQESFREIIGRRLEAAGAEESEVFAGKEVCNELIALSGGQPTQLMTLVREAIITDELPIGKESLKRAKADGRREYARLLRAEHWPIIEEIRSTGSYTRTKDNEPAFRELLDSRAILQYVNDEEWYGLNPMVAALKPPGSPELVQ